LNSNLSVTPIRSHQPRVNNRQLARNGTFRVLQSSCIVMRTAEMFCVSLHLEQNHLTSNADGGFIFRLNVRLDTITLDFTLYRC